MRGLAPGFPSWQQIYGKMLRDFDKLSTTPDADNFMNFVLAANQLYDWIKKDLDIDNATKVQIENDLGGNVHHLGTRRDIANATKHCALTYDSRRIKEVSWPAQSWTGSMGINSAAAYVILIQNDELVMFLSMVQAVKSYWTGLLGAPTHYARVA
jgi:hypothetical protein